MSIAAQIERLQGIKGDIKTELIAKGISASAHNMKDFAADIRNISTGIDVSDTTADVDNVLAGYQFYNANGDYVSGNIQTQPNTGDVELDPTRSQAFREIHYNPGYYPSEHGAYVEEIIVNDLAPSEDGTYVEAWKNYRTIGDGYFYNSYVQRKGIYLVFNTSDSELSDSTNLKPKETIVVDGNLYNEYFSYNNSTYKYTVKKNCSVVFIIGTCQYNTAGTYSNCALFVDDIQKIKVTNSSKTKGTYKTAYLKYDLNEGSVFHWKNITSDGWPLSFGAVYLIIDDTLVTSTDSITLSDGTPVTLPSLL